MTSSFYVKLLATVAVLLAVILVVAIARADYTNGFSRIHEICAASPEIQEGVKGIEMSVPDTFNEDNKGGTILLMAGEGENGIGVGIVIRDKDETPLIGVAIYHLADDTTFVVDLLTGEKDTISNATVQEFINQWMELYNKATGTSI